MFTYNNRRWTLPAAQLTKQENWVIKSNKNNEVARGDIADSAELKSSGLDDAGMSADERKLARLAWVLDDIIPLPGGYRVGVDGIVGLIPGVGDAAGMLASGYILVQAARMGIPNVVIARMAGNVVLEMLVGVVPVVGDLFDFVFKANRRNVALMQASQLASSKRRATKRSSWLVLGSVLLALMLMFAATIWAAFELLSWVISLF